MSTHTIRLSLPPPSTASHAMCPMLTLLDFLLSLTCQVHFSLRAFALAMPFAWNAPPCLKLPLAVSL